MYLCVQMPAVKCPPLPKVAFATSQVFIGNDFKDDDWAARALHRIGLPLVGAKRQNSWLGFGWGSFLETKALEPRGGHRAAATAATAATATSPIPALKPSTMGRQGVNALSWPRRASQLRPISQTRGPR